MTLIQNAPKLTFVTGGQRSGKSSFASKLALNTSKNPIYLATSNEDEVSFNNRVQRHKDDRNDQWTTWEEPLNLHLRPLADAQVILLDCVTLWLNNIFSEKNYNVEKSFSLFKSLWQQFYAQSNNIIVVSNEIGMGLHAESAMGRDFVDLQGWANQHIANQADSAIFMVAGLPLTLK